MTSNSPQPKAEELEKKMRQRIKKMHNNGICECCDNASSILSVQREKVIHECMEVVKTIPPIDKNYDAGYHYGYGMAVHNVESALSQLLTKE